MIDFTIIAAQNNDFLKIIELLKIAASRLKNDGIDQWSYWLNPPQERLEWVKEGFVNHQFYFLRHDNTTIGMYRLMTEDILYWGKMNSKAYYIHSLVIIPAYSGHKLGIEIIKRIKEKALGHHIPYLRLDCNALNKTLCSYYEKIGFIKVGTVAMSHSINNLYELEVRF